ncbi:hypothetical protein ACJJTC_001179 [Scirpophaga incertulas]
MTFEYYADAERKSKRRIRVWYQNNLMNVLEAAKEQRVRGVDASIVLAKQLLQMLNESAQKPAKAPSYALPHYKDYNLMKPVAPEYLELLHASTEKGSTEKYLKARNKIAPEDKYRQARVPARDVNHGRCAILRDTFYRKSNLGPDPRHYSQPSGGQITVCSEYSCNF